MAEPEQATSEEAPDRGGFLKHPDGSIDWGPLSVIALILTGFVALQVQTTKVQRLVTPIPCTKQAPPRACLELRDALIQSCREDPEACAVSGPTSARRDGDGGGRRDASPGSRAPGGESGGDRDSASAPSARPPAASAPAPDVAPPANDPGGGGDPGPRSPPANDGPDPSPPGDGEPDGDVDPVPPSSPPSQSGPVGDLLEELCTRPPAQLPSVCL